MKILGCKSKITCSLKFHINYSIKNKFCYKLILNWSFRRILFYNKLNLIGLISNPFIQLASHVVSVFLFVYNFQHGKSILSIILIEKFIFSTIKTNQASNLYQTTVYRLILILNVVSPKVFGPTSRVRGILTQKTCRSSPRQSKDFPKGWYYPKAPLDCLSWIQSWYDPYCPWSQSSWLKG